MTVENKTWFVSDLHFGHKNIIEYCDRPTTIEELDEWLINKLNSSISENDTVYHIGDFTLKSKNLEYIVSIVSKLNGNWNFVLGNHDDEKTLDKLCAAMPDKCKNLGWYHIYKTKKRKLILHHFPHRSWQDSRQGSINVHGHCVDIETEILTVSGWKFRNELNIDDKIYSLNKETKKLEITNVDKIIDKKYTGNVYSVENRRLNFRVTNEHYKVLYNKKLKLYQDKKIKDIADKSAVTFALNGVFESEGLNLTDYQIKLYVAIASDGNIKESSKLCRIRVKKQRKKDEIENILNVLNIEYREYKSKCGELTSYNFTIPDYLLEYDIKGLDSKFIKMNEKQADIFINEYSIFDGSKNKNCIIIYTSKKSEAEIISHIGSINGWKISTVKTFGGFKSENDSYQLTCKKVSSHNTVLKKQININYVNGENFWCIKTKNENFIIRRKGKIMITGNCHGSLKGKELHNQIDVGIDALDDFNPITLEQLIQIVDDRNKNNEVVNHHEGQKTGNE